MKALYRLYRPTTFEDVSGQRHVVQTLQNQFVAESLAHAYLFTGPRGVGKTTIARLLAKLVNCLHPKKNEPCNACAACEQIAQGHALDVCEIDAASHTDVEHVRENIIQAVRFAPSSLKKKVYIIDEVHMLSGSAFNALLKTLEEPPEHALFILATTEIHKVPETIVSRCQRFDFRKIGLSELSQRLERIVKEEGRVVDRDVLAAIAKHSGGCARDAESLLAMVLALGEARITMKEASLIMPATQQVLVEEFVALLSAGNAPGSIALLNTSLEQGMDLHQFLADTTSWLRDRLLASVAHAGTDDSAFLGRAIEELLSAERLIRSEHIPQLPVELAIIRVCAAIGGRPTDFHKQEVDLSREKKGDEVATPGFSVPRSYSEGVSLDTTAEKSEQTVQVAEAEEEKPTVFDTIPVISIDEVKEKWPQVYEQIKSCNASLPLFMNACEVRGVQGDHVELGFEYDLYVQTVNQEKNRRAIEDVFEKVLGRRLRVKAIQAKRAEAAAVQELLAEFGGSVV
ncbi:DNA polymerase III subunit gamma/tau [Candidatus Uhrbacteria bacterium]|nr:DNA polymerase III subunit gamma/tau [Candidatus Uhrbacteria bacterium]